MSDRKKKRNISQLKLWADIVLFVSFVLVNIPQTTGVPFHEWLSFLFIVPLLIHILLDWKWVVNVTLRLFKKLPGEVRFNHFWDVVIFVVMVFVLFNGTVISEAVLPALGIHLTIDPFWVAMHHQSANLLMVLIGVHLAMHWAWVVNMVNRYIRRKPTQIETSSTRGDE